MSTESSQTQQTAPSSSPATSPVASGIESQLKRVEAFYAQLAELEAKAIEQQTKAIEETLRLSREGLAYGATLSAEWRKASLEATRRTLQMFSSPTSMFPKMPFPFAS